MVTIAVVDSGLDPRYKVKLCPSGHWDYNDGPTDQAPYDTQGHGTNVAGIIDSYAKLYGNNYCLMILRYYHPLNSGMQNLNNIVGAFEYLTNTKPDIVNISGGGLVAYKKERDAIKRILDQGSVIVAAAGNDGEKMTAKNRYYPALYDTRIIVVGNKTILGNRHPTSNWGTQVDVWEVGVNVYGGGMTMTGTSQAAAVHSGKYAGGLMDKKNKR